MNRKEKIKFLKELQAGLSTIETIGEKQLLIVIGENGELIINGKTTTFEAFKRQWSTLAKSQLLIDEYV